MDLLNTKPTFGIKFSSVAVPIAPESRPIWRVSLLVLILGLLSRGNKASSQKLLVLSSIVSSRKKRALLKSVLAESEQASSLNIRFDPSINRAIDFGIAEGVFSLDDAKNVCLTDKGISFHMKIMGIEDLLMIEKDFMSGLTKNDVNEKVVNKLIAG